MKFINIVLFALICSFAFIEAAKKRRRRGPNPPAAGVSSTQLNAGTADGAHITRIDVNNHCNPACTSPKECVKEVAFGSTTYKCKKPTTPKKPKY